MKLDEVKDPIKEIDARAGVYPVYTNEEGQTFVHMMIPSDPRFGGLLPQMGKGGIDEGESAEDAAMREGYEELGLISNNVARITQLTTSVRIGKKEKYQLTVFVAEVKDPDNFDPYGWESGWAGWIELEKAIETSRKDQRQFLRLLKNKYSNKRSTELVENATDDFETYINNKYDNVVFSVYDSSEDLIKLDSIIIKDKKQGTGTQIMGELCDYADKNNKRIILIPGTKDDHHGTTSRIRLVKFYKRFGFIENKGRRRDFSLPAGMIREPQ